MVSISKLQIKEIQSSLPSLSIITPDSPEYGAAISRWNVLSERNAGAIVFPTAAPEVSQLLSYANTYSLDIAIKAGGHGNRGSSPNPGGLCIDLSKLSSVSVELATKRITAEGGALWSHVYSEAAKFNLTAVGGISPTVGVGGLALHGGYGWLTGAHGLAADNIVEMEVALADGIIVCASDRDNQDLFWAMKGAGAMFGAVTKFVLQGYEQKEWVWTGNLVLGKGVEKVVARISNRVLSGDSQGKAALVWGWSVLPKGTEPVLWVVPWYNGPEHMAKEFFAPLLDLKLMVNTTKMVPFTALGPANTPSPGGESRKCGQGSSLMAPLDEALLEALYAKFKDFLDQVPDATKSTIAFEVYDPHATMKIGQTATAFSNRGYQTNVQTMLTWTEAQNDDLCRSWCQQFSVTITEEFERRQQNQTVDEVTRISVGIYSNYDGFRLGAKAFDLAQGGCLESIMRD